MQNPVSLTMHLTFFKLLKCSSLDKMPSPSLLKQNFDYKHVTLEMTRSIKYVIYNHDIDAYFQLVYVNISLLKITVCKPGLVVHAINASIQNTVACSRQISVSSNTSWPT